MNVQGKIGMALQERNSMEPDPANHLINACMQMMAHYPGSTIDNLAFGTRPRDYHIEALKQTLPGMFIAMIDIANAVTRITGQPFNLEQLALERSRES